MYTSSLNFSKEGDEVILTGSRRVNYFHHVELLPDCSQSTRVLSTNYTANLLSNFSGEDRHDIRGHHITSQPQDDTRELLQEGQEIRVERCHVWKDDCRHLASCGKHNSVEDTSNHHTLRGACNRPSR